ncbi:flagellar biosynthesis protein FlgA [Nocardia mangyaensis]|uniref:Flagellar biosynthesis protein FlgA n=1 Tax=Nocardia mangyaensis TaxID=2213200 RepID=A0A1J0VYX9_9NOCA|nr:SAF domain-containing protein [Nocardia mangyaensis]APE37210.1 flagellar biosynthesis protein FlgA [Nocardia mangyaensis]
MTRSLADLGRGSSWRFALGNRPAWADALLVRRIAAAALALVALALFIRGDPGGARVAVVVAATDLAPGRLLTAADLRVDHYESRSLPTGFVVDTADLVGATLTGAMRSGETFTDLRVVGPRLAAAAAGSTDARIVPIRLADSAVAEVLRAGDRVDVIGVEDAGGPGATRPARTLATDAAVVLVTGHADRRAGTERVVLVALDGEYATAVAGASLRTALTVVFH